MDIQVRLGPGLTQVAGGPQLTVTLPAGATIQDLLGHLRDTYPDHASGISAALPIVRGSYVTKERELAPGEQVALLMPVSGG